MGDNKGQTIFLSVIGIATLLVAIIGATFAYFTTTLTGPDAKVEASTATLGAVTYTANGITATDKILPGWSGTDTITLSLEPSDVDVDFVCYISPSALGGDGDPLTDFYVTASATANGDNTVTTMTGEHQFVTADKTTPVQIASGTLKGGNDVANTQDITYTVSFKETGTDQNSQQTKAFAAVVNCKLKSTDVYYTHGQAGGTTTKPKAPGEE